MKRKKILKFLIILLGLITIFSLHTSHVQASTISNALAGAGEFIEDGVQDDGPTIDTGNMEEMSDALYNVLLVVATVIAAIVGLIIGIQFMVGGVSQKAKLKETLIPYIAGCIVIFGAFGIWRLVVNILSQV